MISLVIMAALLSGFGYVLDQGMPSKIQSSLMPVGDETFDKFYQRTYGRVRFPRTMFLGVMVLPIWLRAFGLPNTDYIAAVILVGGVGWLIFVLIDARRAWREAERTLPTDS